MAMDTFIKVAEVWKPDAEGNVLEHAGGCYDAAPAFGALSSRMCFGRAEGLPGAAWDEGRPQLWTPLPAQRFLRARAAADAGLVCALALPVVVDGRLTSVAVLFCSGDASANGAVELWHNDARITCDLRLEQGYFNPPDSAVETLARDGFLSRGDGAPGQAWQKGAAVFIDDLPHASSFLRAQAAGEAGLVRALALPCSALNGQAWIVSLLASKQTPLAHRVEGWLVDRATGGVKRGFGYCEHAGRLSADEGGGHALAAMGAIGAAARGGCAEVGPALHAALDGAAAQAAGLRSVLALPLPGDAGIDEVVALYF
jgi:hypothetical protein